LSASLDANHRASLGQFFTPSSAANLITEMVSLPDRGTLRVLDPGAGIGSLTASLVAKVVRERPELQVSVCAIEVDSFLVPHLEETLRKCRELATAAGAELTTEVVSGDLVELATGWKRELFNQFDVVVMNPPYRKLAARSIERKSLAALGVDSPNLYSTFLAIGTLALIPGGQLVAITPRSFANGPYFAEFRRFLLSQVALDRIHVFDSRSTVFADTKVLQENIVFSARKWLASDGVTLSASRGSTDSVFSREVRYNDIVRPGDRHQFIHIPSQEEDTSISEMIFSLPCTMAETGVQVSTGKVVEFRAREHLLPVPASDSVPLIYPGNLKRGRVHWPFLSHKPQALAMNNRTRKLIWPAERFVLVKRFSAKEERRRVVAAVYEPDRSATAGIGFENHLNVFHVGGRGLDWEFAQGLCLWLNSSVVDRFFRTFSGHTQVNATDLRALRYPSREQLQSLGATVRSEWPDQKSIDELVTRYVFMGRVS
jgi:adenine-specific DNA-methyltransferase